MRALLAFVAACALGFAPAPLPRRASSEFLERFAVSAEDATAGYHSLAYEETIRGCKAEIKDGRLRLRGDRAGEGDQRLVVTARRATGREQLPDSLEVTTRLGGTNGAPGAWHVGVSVGRVKVLFHPGHAGGAFRAEALDQSQQFVGNEDMAFTPAADAVYEMTIRVRRADGVYRFEVTVADPKGGRTHRRAFDITSEQMGNYDRVGLERSGQRGGDALFESLGIRPGR